MSIRTHEELMNALRARLGEDISDDALALVEDVDDTFRDLETKATPSGENWEERYHQLDQEWRNRYMERFYNSGTTPPPPEVNSGEEDSAATEIQIDDLFND